MRELRDRELSDRLKDELMKNAVGAGPRMPNTIDPHWLELHRRYVIHLDLGIFMCYLQRGCYNMIPLLQVPWSWTWRSSTGGSTAPVWPLPHTYGTKPGSTGSAGAGTI